jgi:hypothetical protein
MVNDKNTVRTEPVEVPVFKKMVIHLASPSTSSGRMD